MLLKKGANNAGTVSSIMELPEILACCRKTRHKTVHREQFTLKSETQNSEIALRSTAVHNIPFTTG
jgi:hypothetical protein